MIPITFLKIHVCENRMVYIKQHRNIFSLSEIHFKVYRYFDGTKKYFKLHLRPDIWANARAICKAEGGNLAVIRNKAEEAFLISMFREPGNRLNDVPYPDHAMIGIHDFFREGHFETVLGWRMKKKNLR